jgi:hypothetical protein
MTRLDRSSAVAAALTGLAAFAVYLFTMSRSVGFIDSGELAAVASGLGIAHPTGYPLYTLLGRVAVMLPLGVEEVVRLNLLSALLGSAGVVLMFFAVRTVLLAPAWNPGGAREQGRGFRGNVASAAAALLFAFSETAWSQALVAEVYALHGFMISAVALLFLRAAAARPPRAALWAAAAFVLGLSFGNHMTTVLLVPGLALLVWSSLGRSRGERGAILRMIPPFLLGLSVYLYLPVRGAAGPWLSWGDPTSPGRFFSHLRGKQYSIWIFSSTEATARQFSHFLGSFPAEFAYAGAAVALAGLAVLFRRSRILAGVTTLFFVFCVLYAINYDIHDIDSYFLLAYWTTALWAGVGVEALLGRMPKLPKPAAVILALLLPLAAFTMHRTTVDESGNRLVEDYTRNLLASVRPNALVLSYQWDFWLSGSYYYQLVRGMRPDVAVVDKELLRRSWYFKEIGRRHPWLLKESRAEVDLFLRELEKFERDLPYDPAVIQGRFEGMIRSFLARSMESRPVYVTAEIEPEFWRGFDRVPEGLAYRLKADTAFYPTARPRFERREFARRGRLEDMFTKLYTDAWVSRGYYYMIKRRDTGEAVHAAGEALGVDSASVAARQLLDVVAGRMPPSR